MAIDDTRKQKLAANNQLSDFTCPDCHNSEWGYIRQENRWIIRCENCGTKILSVKPDITQPKRTNDRISPVDVNPFPLSPFACIWAIVILMSGIVLALTLYT